MITAKTQLIAWLEDGLENEMEYIQDATSRLISMIELGKTQAEILRSDLDESIPETLQNLNMFGAW